VLTPGSPVLIGEKMSSFANSSAVSTIGQNNSLLEENNSLHRALAYFNRKRLAPALRPNNRAEGRHDEQSFLVLEANFIERELGSVAAMVGNIPRCPEAFVTWFEGLRDTGPGQDDPLFPWLATDATREQMRWFLLQEVAGEAGFEDLVALTQIKMPARPKLELARNFWDEMGRGNEDGMHGPMLGRLARAMEVDPVPETTVWEALALSNMMIGLAANRYYAYQSIGALGVIELTAPGRAVDVAKGLRRLGLDGKARVYFELHSALDIRHSEAWNREVVAPLVAENPDIATAIAEGALLRLRAGARCFRRYREEFSVS
jgi:hypothetical protein